MSYTFKSIAEVELLNTMPENANSIVEVGGALKRGPNVVNELANVEVLESAPEQSTILAEVEGKIKRIPGKGLGGGWDFIISYSDSMQEYYWAKGDKDTLVEALLSGTPPTICLHMTDGKWSARASSITDIEFWQGSGFGLYLRDSQGHTIEVLSDGSIITGPA